MKPGACMRVVLMALALLLPALPAFGVSAAVQVSATIPSQGLCFFRTAAANLPFGNLISNRTTDAFATGTLQVLCFTFSPTSTFVIGDNDGMYETGPGAYRMRHATNPAAYLPYQFSYTPASATIPRMVWTTITLTGRVRPSSLNPAQPGNYTDTVTLTLLP